MKTIWKFTLKTTDYQAIDMPKGAQLLSVQTQRQQPCIWALVDSDAPMAPRGIVIQGTGHDCKRVAAAAFVGTYQIHGGGLVFHVFDSGEMKLV